MSRSLPARRALLVALVALAAAPAEAQPRPGAQADAALIQEVLAFREKVRAAVAAGDRAALEAAYADNFSHLRDSGRTDLKGERIALLLKGEPAIETAPEEGMTVQVYGPGVAVVTGTSPILDRAAGRSAPFRWLTLYVKRDDRWQVALSQASRVANRGR